MYPWEGAKKPLTTGIMVEVAQSLDIDLATLKAVWEVESGGEFWDKHGVISRFEPHKLAKPIGTWRTSLKIGRARRWEMFLAAYANDPEDAIRAASWGAPQIMGFNHKAAGYPTAAKMVEAMAQSANNHVRIFAAFITSAKLATHLRAKNWRAFARGYNGSGQVDVYATKLERAYRRHSGLASEVVLSVGASGATVRKLQRLLKINVDGHFGAKTKAAVKRFQRDRGLESDGVVGAKTWAALLPASDPQTSGQAPTKKLNWLPVLVAAILKMIGGKK